MSFSKHFRLSTKASQISTKKCSFLCFNSYQMGWEGSKMGQHLRQNVPFCYLTYTMALACLGICTTIVTIQRMCFKQPLCWGFCHVWHTSTNAQPSRQWLLFQASSSTCETSIWTMIKKVSSHAGRHVFSNAAANSMSTWCGDTMLYHLPLWPVSMMSVITNYIFSVKTRCKHHVCFRKV